MTNDIRTKGNPFIERAEQIRSKSGVPMVVPVEPKTRNTPKARLNFIPDDLALTELVNGALSALSRGVRWARGSILNLLV